MAAVSSEYRSSFSVRQWLKYNGTQGNAVPPPPIYGSKHSPTSDCYNARERHTTIVRGSNLDVAFHFNHWGTRRRDHITEILCRASCVPCVRRRIFSKINSACRSKMSEIVFGCGLHPLDVSAYNRHQSDSEVLHSTDPQYEQSAICSPLTEHVRWQRKIHLFKQ